MKPELLIAMPMPDGYAERLAEDFTIHYHPRIAADDPVLDQISGTVRAVLTNGTIGAGAALMDRLENVEIVSSFGAGYENIDIAAARQRDIAVTYGPGTNTHSVADMAMCLMMCAARRIPAADRAARGGQWSEFRDTARPTISRHALGVIGLGRIGRAVARRAEASDMTVSYYGPQPKDDVSYPYHDTLTALARQSDFLVVCCPGGPGTRHLVDRDVLTALGPDGFLVNVARASIVDTQALIDVLKDGVIAGAAVDVYDDEPNIPDALKKLDNVVLTPHISGSADDATHAKYLLYMENMRAHFDGARLPTPAP
jgi:lactate dehydrogenase-like 2-hydroxyacid dehydrogenase